MVSLVDHCFVCEDQPMDMTLVCINGFVVYDWSSSVFLSSITHIKKIHCTISLLKNVQYA